MGRAGAAPGSAPCEGRWVPERAGLGTARASCLRGTGPAVGGWGRSALLAGSAQRCAGGMGSLVVPLVRWSEGVSPSALSGLRFGQSCYGLTRNGGVSVGRAEDSRLCRTERRPLDCCFPRQQADLSGGWLPAGRGRCYVCLELWCCV